MALQRIGGAEADRALQMTNILQEEMKALMKELKELTGGSIPKKKLEDAKSKDAQLNK